MLMTEAKQKGWTVISMKNDWKKIFASERINPRLNTECTKPLPF